MSYNFKTIRPVMPAKDMINVILSKTQRKTPTVVHPGYDISRIRGFYMRKVKFTQETIHEKIDAILQDFPKLDDIHPFYADLINVLYDKDHYKLALGHVHACRNVIDNIAKDYCRLLKYGDSLYRCKMLKRAALGRMCTTLKKLTSSLNYLDEVRKHLSRMPAINPFERTLLVTGFPNVGKSSFVNNITNANLDVQPYPFTTQNLYVGHTDYNFVRWQVIDTPGVLDHSLSERNPIEMQAITALAHLKACIMFFLDISETCSYSIDQQIALFKDLKPLFKNKPLLLVMTKIDIKKFEQLDPIDQQKLQDVIQSENVFYSQLSNKSGEGIALVKEKACNLLNEWRQNLKPEQLTGGNPNLLREESILQGVYIAQPKRVNQNRMPVIPQVVGKLNRPTLKDVQEQNGGAGVFSFPLQEHFLLDNPDWKYDAVPEIMDGKNIGDFVDADILQRLEELEKEEEMMDQAEVEDPEEDAREEMLLNTRDQVNKKREMIKEEHHMKMKQQVKLHRPNLEDAKEDFAKKGIDTTFLEQRAQKFAAKKVIQKQKRQQHSSDDSDDNDMDIEGNERNQRKGRDALSRSRSRLREISRSRSRGNKKVLTAQEQAMERMSKKIQRRRRNEAKAGDGDTKIDCKMPKHLFTGKSGIGKQSRR
ncbi:unnamed protein product [Paramecium octaurelia]|uniref:Nucleolar GTP-binding protein 1 n=1 Tax=Paramecium octaurelia TaxID=43137 RepID=A0A8S1T2K8_PAROT|nr:unnamed protein product [Paramecium octaurelia]